MSNSIRYNDGELILDDDGLMCAVGVTANKAMCRINKVLNDKRVKQAKCILTDEQREDALQKAVREIFDGVNDCTIILGVG